MAAAIAITATLGSSGSLLTISSTTPKTNAIRMRTDAIKIGSFTFAGRILVEESVASPSNVRMIPRRLDVKPPMAPITNNVTNDTRIHPCAHALICAPR